VDGITELALMFKKRENQPVQGICVGKVLAPPPQLKITVNGFILENEDLVVANHLLATYTSSSTNIATHGDHSHTVSDILQAGGRVIVMPSADNATYFILDKVGDL